MKKRYLLLSGTSAFLSGYLLTRFIHEKRKITKENLDNKDENNANIKMTIEGGIVYV